MKLYLKYHTRCIKLYKLPEVRVVISSKPSRKSTCFIARSICINIVGFVDVVPTQLVRHCSLCVVASIHIVFLCSSNGVFVEKLSFVLCTTWFYPLKWLHLVHCICSEPCLQVTRVSHCVYLKNKDRIITIVHSLQPTREQWLYVYTTRVRTVAIQAYRRHTRVIQDSSTCTSRTV